MFVRCLAGLMLAMAASSTVEAGAWAQPKGKGQVILKAEVMRASRGYDPNGIPRPLSRTRTDRAISVFSEYGLTDRLTVRFKGEWQSGEDAFVDYAGQGPAEVGLAWQAYRDPGTAVSVYAGYAISGDGRNAGYATPGAGERDWEVRLAAGRSFERAGQGPLRHLMPERSFVEVEAARRTRTGLPDETRVDLTLGGHSGRNWMVLAQAFGGMAEDGGPRWLSVETSVVRHLGPWSMQAGWRSTVAGRETPIAEGAVLAIWRRF